ncbi:MAG: ParA family protein [Planctomycetes bacterium]|nr:ParA family protein [Planctomycetota bacterium]
MDTVAVINQKGGVGKTTTTVNLGVALAGLGKSVLLVDLDPQANLGTHLGVDVMDGKTIYDVLVHDVKLKDVIRETPESGVSVVPSNLDLSAAEMELVSMVGRETLLRDALEVLDKGSPGHYDVVLLDCPPSLGVLTINALTASRQVLVPLQAEFFALQGMAKLTEIISLVQRRLNPDVELTGIVACKVDRRTKLTQEVLDEVRRFFGDRLLETVIRPNVKLAEAPSHGQSVLSYAPDSNGAVDYRRLAREWAGIPLETDSPGGSEAPVSEVVEQQADAAES